MVESGGLNPYKVLSKNKCSQSRAHMVEEKKYNYSQACKQFYGY